MYGPKVPRTRKCFILIVSLPDAIVYTLQNNLFDLYVKKKFFISNRSSKRSKRHYVFDVKDFFFPLVLKIS